MVYQRIRDLREDSDLKQRELADYLHCSQQVYSNYELGQRDIPTEILIALAEYYHTNVDYLLGLTSVRVYYKELDTE
ncbi:MAG: helix-turn-helix transcriptional regulator [Oscillospiraceae bacterium]|nr:helix-turn-helix transcriptional regulator [Oscillospiraceae bacterium]